MIPFVSILPFRSTFEILKNAFECLIILIVCVNIDERRGPPRDNRRDNRTDNRTDKRDFNRDRDYNR